MIDNNCLRDPENSSAVLSLAIRVGFGKGWNYKGWGSRQRIWALGICNEFAMNMNAAEHENKITANLCQLLEKLFQSFLVSNPREGPTLDYSIVFVPPQRRGTVGWGWVVRGNGISNTQCLSCAGEKGRRGILNLSKYVWGWVLPLDKALNRYPKIDLNR